MKIEKITWEYQGDKQVLLCHLPGNRSLTRAYPDNRVRWAVRFAVIPMELAPSPRERMILFEDANEKGRPLTEEESTARLLAHRLIQPTPVLR